MSVCIDWMHVLANLYGIRRDSQIIWDNLYTTSAERTRYGIWCHWYIKQRAEYISDNYRRFIYSDVISTWLKFASWLMWYNCVVGVPCTRFPIPQRGAGATDHCEYLPLVKAIAMIVTTIALCVLAATIGIGGSTSMIAAFAIHLAVHFTIVVGNRVEGIPSLPVPTELT